MEWSRLEVWKKKNLLFTIGSMLCVFFLVKMGAIIGQTFYVIFVSEIITVIKLTNYHNNYQFC